MIKKLLAKKFYEVATKKVQEIQNEAYFDLFKSSPIRSGTYIDGLKKMPIIQWEWFVKTSIVNTASYSQKVEKGWRKTSVNWHLADGTIYRAKWAKVFEKAKKYLDKDLKNL